MSKLDDDRTKRAAAEKANERIKALSDKKSWRKLVLPPTPSTAAGGRARASPDLGETEDFADDSDSADDDALEGSVPPPEPSPQPGTSAGSGGAHEAQAAAAAAAAAARRRAMVNYADDIGSTPRMSAPRRTGSRCPTAAKTPSTGSGAWKFRCKYEK